MTAATYKLSFDQDFIFLFKLNNKTWDSFEMCGMYSHKHYTVRTVFLQGVSETLLRWNSLFVVGCLHSCKCLQWREALLARLPVWAVEASAWGLWCWSLFCPRRQPWDWTLRHPGRPSLLVFAQQLWMFESLKSESVWHVCVRAEPWARGEGWRQGADGHAGHCYSFCQEAPQSLVGHCRRQNKILAVSPASHCWK